MVCDERFSTVSGKIKINKYFYDDDIITLGL